MAFIKETTLKGIPIPNTYFKITSTNIDETGEDEKGKLYRVSVTVNSFTDETKKYDLKQHTYYLENFRENELSLPNIYTRLLAETEEFNWATNV